MTSIYEENLALVLFLISIVKVACICIE